MFKTAVSLEETGKVQIVALDKTGTITSGEPKVTDVIPDSKIAREELLEIAYALERKVSIRWQKQFYPMQRSRKCQMASK